MATLPHAWWRDRHGHLSHLHFPVLAPLPTPTITQVSAFRRESLTLTNRWNLLLEAGIEPLSPITPTSPARKRHQTSNSKKVLADDKVLRTRKIRLLPTKGQKKLFHQFFKMTNIGYNMALHHINQRTDISYVDEKGVLHEGIADHEDWMALNVWLRAPTLNTGAPPTWFKSNLFHSHKHTLADLQQAAIQQMCHTMTATLASTEERINRIRQAAGHPLQNFTNAQLRQRFSMKNRTVHANTQRFFIKKNGGNTRSITWSATGITFWSRILKHAKVADEVRVRDKRQLRKLTELNGRSTTDVQVIIKYERPGRYYACIPLELPVEPASEQPTVNIVALDPGVRTFQSTCDDTGRFVKYASQTQAETRNRQPTRLMKLALKADKLRSQHDNNLVNTVVAPEVTGDGHVNVAVNLFPFTAGERKSHRRRYKKKLLLQHMKARHLKEDLQRKVANELLTKYTHVMIPQFAVRGMVQRMNPVSGQWRVMHRTAVRKMLFWGHFQFQQRLMQMSARWEDRRVIVVGEEYTSKTCSGCGWVHPKLGGRETFRCQQADCLRVMDRDWNAALNIMLKNIESVVAEVSCDEDDVQQMAVD